MKILKKLALKDVESLDKDEKNKRERLIEHIRLMVENEAIILRDLRGRGSRVVRLVDFLADCTVEKVTK